MSKVGLNKLRSDLNAVYEDPFIGDTVNKSCLPFPEFSDQDVNSENWDKPFQNVCIELSIIIYR